MAAFFGILILVLLVTAAVAIARLVWRWLSAPTQTTQPTQRPASSPGMSAEEEGNVHSGPYGYSPNTAYPETQYGSMFNPDAEWNHEEQ